MNPDMPVVLLRVTPSDAGSTPAISTNFFQKSHGRGVFDLQDLVEMEQAKVLACVGS